MWSTDIGAKLELLIGLGIEVGLGLSELMLKLEGSLLTLGSGCVNQMSVSAVILTMACDIY